MNANGANNLIVSSVLVLGFSVGMLLLAELFLTDLAREQLARREALLAARAAASLGDHPVTSMPAYELAPGVAYAHWDHASSPEGAAMSLPLERGMSIQRGTTARRVRASPPDLDPDEARGERVVRAEPPAVEKTSAHEEPKAKTSVEIRREQGAKRLDAVLRQIAAEANEIDALWVTYLQCAQTDGARLSTFDIRRERRQWIGRLDDDVRNQIPLIQDCQRYRYEIKTKAARLAEVLQSAEAQAHRDWVRPGVRRQLRRKYELERL